jgi:uncharacterized protein YjiS (DUF1127 family)
MASDRRLRKFVRQWRTRYPYPVPWVDRPANKQCRRSENQWLAQFDGVAVLRRRDVLALALWKLGGDGARHEAGVAGISGPAEWGHARRCIKRALAAPNPNQALDHLVGATGGVPGWGPEMASVVLAACRPATYVVADARCLRSLHALALLEPSVEEGFSREKWWPYLRTCRHLAELSGVSLRDVGRALWAGADGAPGLPS